jgi:hypothetical protein
MIKMRGLRAVGVVGVTVALLAAACSGSSSKTPIGTVADVGFRPGPNGFPFENYGLSLADGTTPTNLTAADLQAMFGDRVCADANSGRCDLIPGAQAWLDSTNQQMAGGHCFGFSVAAELLWQQKLNVNTFGAASTNGLDDNNQKLQRQIAYDWALQLLDSVQSKRTAGTPNQILAKLQKVLTPHPSETYTIGIWKSDGTAGHAVTPYAVENKGGGQFAVVIYDNNWPGETRAITFDTKANTWSYDAAVNPSAPDELYEGDAKTKTLTLFPTSPGLGTQPCPFCGKVPTNPNSSGGVKHNTEEIYLDGGDTNHADLIITDHAGHRLGYIGGKLVNQIPGAHIDDLISGDWTDTLTPDFFVPANGRYTLTIDGTTLTGTDTETLGIVGPSYDLSVNDIPVHQGDKDILVVQPDATKLSYTSSRPESPTLKLGVSDKQADYSFAISGVSDQPGSTINLSIPAEGGSLSMDNVGSTGVSTLNLRMTRETEQGVQVFRHDAIPLAGGDKAELQFGNWTNPSQGIPLITTHTGQRSTQTLTDQQTG